MAEFYTYDLEAAGVEPASENTSSQSTTCVSPFNCRGRLRTEPSAPSASPEKFHHHASRRTVMTSLLNDGQSQATGLLRVTAHWLLSSESVVCVRSYVCVSTGFTRTWSLGTRSAIPHPRRSQIAPMERRICEIPIQSTRYWMPPTPDVFPIDPRFDRSRKDLVVQFCPPLHARANTLRGKIR